MCNKKAELTGWRLLLDSRLFLRVFFFLRMEMSTLEESLSATLRISKESFLSLMSSWISREWVNFEPLDGAQICSILLLLHRLCLPCVTSFSSCDYSNSWKDNPGISNVRDCVPVSRFSQRLSNTRFFIRPLDCSAFFREQVLLSSRVGRPVRTEIPLSAAEHCSILHSSNVLVLVRLTRARVLLWHNKNRLYYAWHVMILYVSYLVYSGD